MGTAISRELPSLPENCSLEAISSFLYTLPVSGPPLGINQGHPEAQCGLAEQTNASSPLSVSLFRISTESSHGGSQEKTVEFPYRNATIPRFPEGQANQRLPQVQHVAASARCLPELWLLHGPRIREGRFGRVIAGSTFESACRTGAGCPSRFLRRFCLGLVRAHGTSR